MQIHGVLGRIQVLKIVKLFSIFYFFRLFAPIAFHNGQSRMKRGR